jgi:hypothetical protein
VSLLQPGQAWTREQKACPETVMKKYCKKTASLLQSLPFFLYLKKVYVSPIFLSSSLTVITFFIITHSTLKKK